MILQEIWIKTTRYTDIPEQPESFESIKMNVKGLSDEEGCYIKKQN